MDFNNLPPDWPSIPLTDPDHISDVLDLLVNLQARRRGALMLLICDQQRRLLQPVQIDGMPSAPLPDTPVTLTRMAAALARTFPGCTALCAIARPRRLRVTEADLAWRRCLDAAFEGHVELLGLHLVTLDGSLPIESLDPAA